jgi:hypothetical protein
MESDMQNSYQSNSDNVMMNAAKGAIAGAIAVWAMDRLDWFMFEHEDQAARRRTESVRPEGLDPAHVSANRAAEAMGTELHPKQPHPAGVAIHYALGIGPAAIYGAFREKLPVERHGQDFWYGLGLGLGLFVIQDEGLNQALGLSGKQKDYPWQAHARGLIAHLTLGLVTNTMLNLLQAPRPMPRQSVAAAYQPETEFEQDSEFMPIGATRQYDEARPTVH